MIFNGILRQINQYSDFNTQVENVSTISACSRDGDIATQCSTVNFMFKKIKLFVNGCR